MALQDVPDLDSLALLLLVGDLGSLGRAGLAHGISQPAVSARIRSMEALTGLRLVYRSPRGSMLSPAGALLAGWARDVLAAAAVLEVGVASLRSDRDSQLRVAASLTVAEHLVPGWLVRLATRQPATAVSLHAMNSAAVERAVRSGEVDLGFVEGPAVGPGLDSRTVGRDRLVVIVPPGHPWARPRRVVAAAELRATRLVQREPDSGTRTAGELALARFGPPAAPLLELSTSGAVVAAVAAGAGPALLSRLAVADDLAAHRVVVAEVSGVDLVRRLRAVWPAGRRPQGPARDLLDVAVRSGQPQPV